MYDEVSSEEPVVHREVRALADQDGDEHLGFGGILVLQDQLINRDGGGGSIVLK